MRAAAGCLLALCLAGPAVTRAGDAPGEFTVGMEALMNGDYAEAYHHWIPLAELGYAEAQYHIGWLYANGNGLAVDIRKALHWWQQAAAQGHADAQFAVGLAYTTGEGMKKDIDQAVKWYLTAAHQGHQDARDILIRLNGDPRLDLLANHPEVAREDWFGWQATVNGERINVRGGPGTGHEIVAQLEKGASVRVIGQRDKWLMVVLPDPATEGGIAWIYQSLLSSASR
jgi:hypothetical protein